MCSKILFVWGQKSAQNFCALFETYTTAYQLLEKVRSELLRSVCNGIQTFTPISHLFPLCFLRRTISLEKYYMLQMNTVLLVKIHVNLLLYLYFEFAKFALSLRFSKCGQLESRYRFENDNKNFSSNLQFSKIEVGRNKFF